MKLQFKFGVREIIAVLLGVIIGMSLFRLHMLFHGQNPDPEHASSLVALSESLDLLGATAIGTRLFYGWKFAPAIGLVSWAASALILDAFVLSVHSVAGWTFLVFAFLIAHDAWKDD